MSQRSFSHESRKADLGAMAAETCDLLVIGGGITGAGVARDAALRGFRVALVERRDFACGTSSRSSKLIHGGVRYLQQGDVGLVLEAAEERRILRRIAPHLTQPRPMLVPAYGRGTHTKLNLGLWTYEKLAGIPEAERHEMLDRDGALAREPGLRADGLTGAAIYPENVTDDARLVLATIRSAHRAGALIANYAEAHAVAADSDSYRVLVRDVEQGGELAVKARVVVNAAGPWCDAVRAFEGGLSGPKLRLTKGIHFTVRHDDLPVRQMVILRAPDKRQIFAIPRGEVVYVGTTDTDYGVAEDYPQITEEDVLYLIAGVRAVFPAATWGMERVVTAWAGLRPLIHQDGKQPSEISRKDEIMNGARGMISVAGGKLTTYRNMAQRVVDLAAARLRSTSAATSADTPLDGGDLPASPSDFARSLGERYADAAGVSSSMLERLVMYHGSGAEALLARAVAERSGLLPGAAALAVEVDHAVDYEMAIRLVDVLERRLRLLLFAPGRGLAAADAVAQRMGQRLGWSAARRERELDDYRRIAAACVPVSAASLRGAAT
jgi:glycerol-3-phosphate dehydrogenase